MALTLKEAIQLLESGDWLKHLRFITADINKRVGGKVVEFNKCRIARHQDHTKINQQYSCTRQICITYNTGSSAQYPFHT